MRRFVTILACAILLLTPESALAAKKKKKPKPAHTTQPAPAKRKPEKPQPPKPVEPPKPIAKPTPAPAAPLPEEKPKPPKPSEPPATAPPIPEEPPAKPAAVPPPAPAAPPIIDQIQDDAACRSALLSMGVEFIIPESVPTSGACGIVNPVELSAIASQTGKIGLPGGPLLNCRFAKQFATWAADIAAPVAKIHLGSSLAAISTGSGYECRGRNGDSSAKLSEHALGNAVDIDALVLADKTRIAIGHEKPGPETRMSQALRISGCGYFTTVLGPGSNEAHKEHYHFDFGMHGKSSNYRICE